MGKYLVSVIVCIAMVFTLSSCSESDRLVKELYDELSIKTEECVAINRELTKIRTEQDALTHERDSLEYERDAFLDENIELRDKTDEYEGKEEEFGEILETLLSVTGMYRDDLADIADYINGSADFPVYATGIPVTHRDVINVFADEYIDLQKSNPSILQEPEPIMGILHINVMPRDELHRPARENCTYYKVSFYQSFIYPYEPGTLMSVPRGPFDGFITHWLLEIEDGDSGPEVIVFEPNA